MNLENITKGLEIAIGTCSVALLGNSIYKLATTIKKQKIKSENEAKKYSLELNAGTDYYGD